MPSSPLISVIITCFNHALYVKEAVASVLAQDYEQIEIIIIDDASTDCSREVIQQILLENPSIKILLNEINSGVCASFNRAFACATGDYIIDLAADDYLLPNKITTQLNKFYSLPDDYGVIYSDLIFVDELGKALCEINTNKSFPEGDVFCEVLARHSIYASTMLIKREVYEDLKGYDESLAYEDFDFFVRSSRNWKFAYVKEPLMAKRELDTSLGKQFFTRSNLLDESTLKVCQKAKALCRNSEEKKALKSRLHYEAYDAIRHSEWRLALRFLLV